MEVTKEIVDLAREDTKTAYMRYSNLARLTHTAENIWKDKKKAFEALDYQLALIDGRLIKVEPTKKSKSIKLTFEQLLIVAEKLGIDVDNET